MISLTTKLWFSFDSLISYFIFQLSQFFTFPALIEQLIKFDSWPARWSLYLDDALPIRGLWINHFEKLHSMLHRSLTHTFAKLSNSCTYVRCAQKSLIIWSTCTYIAIFVAHIHWNNKLQLHWLRFHSFWNARAKVEAKLANMWHCQMPNILENCSL